MVFGDIEGYMMLSYLYIGDLFIKLKRKLFCRLGWYIDINGNV